MTTYRIVCTEQLPISQPPSHAHIVAVGIGTNPNAATQKMTLAEVLSAIDQGHIFYTQGIQSGKTARVEKFVCPHCRKYHIRSTPDAVPDNNLDSLRYCNWEK